MKRYILALLILIAAMAPFFIFKGRYCPLNYSLIEQERGALDTYRKNISKYLKIRKDKLVLIEARKVLSIDADDLFALWAKAEVFRRTYRFKESEVLLKQVISESGDYAPALISLAYIRYHDNKFGQALKILRQVLRQSNLEQESKALSLMLIGSINAKRASLGGFLSKIICGLQVKGFFLKAKNIAPDLAEVRLGLGSFYLLAPKIAGGDIDKAIAELGYAVKLAPDFATANARLAQGYKKKGDLEKYNFYKRRAEELDPENEVLKKIKKQTP